jgi:hypothetical protein
MCGGPDVRTKEPDKELYANLEKIEHAMVKRFPKASVTVVDPAFVTGLPSELKVKGELGRYHLNSEGLRVLKNQILPQ